jgi:hypothetical protein
MGAMTLLYGARRVAAWSIVLICALAPALAHAQTPSSQPDQSAPASSQATKVLLFEPYTAGGLNSDIKISRTILGECDEPSQVDVNRPDAWACTAGSEQFDPCFQNFNGSQLACMDLPKPPDATVSPASLMSVVILNPSTPLDQTQANTPGPEATPFLMELVDGEFCVPEPADVRFASLPVYGYCTNGYWFGAGDLSKPLWTLPILVSGATPSVTNLINIGVLSVWY